MNLNLLLLQTAWTAALFSPALSSFLNKQTTAVTLAIVTERARHTGFNGTGARTVPVKINVNGTTLFEVSQNGRS